MQELLYYSSGPNEVCKKTPKKTDFVNLGSKKLLNKAKINS